MTTKSSKPAGPSKTANPGAQAVVTPAGVADGRPQPAVDAHVVTTPTDALRHSVPPRGLEVVPSSDVTAGRYGRMFRNLPIHEHIAANLTLLARTMIAKPDAPADRPGDLDKDLGVQDDDENTFIPAGYTYFGQFIDHDITFDPVSTLQRQNDPDALEDFRTPRFDLDNIYGRGPSDQPYLYDPDAENIKFLLGKFVDTPTTATTAGPDLPRNVLPDGPGGRARGRALIGDPRNDENLIVSQLQSAFLRFHNVVVDRVRADPATAQLGSDDVFKEAQRIVRWHYQWVVTHDFLYHVAGKAVVDDILGDDPNEAGTYAALDGHFVVGGPVPQDGATLAELAAGTPVRTRRPRLRFYHWRERPFMPVEFTVAAYRFGHSMVRPSYFFNDFVRTTLLAAHEKDPVNKRLRTPIFGPDTDNQFANLNGFRPLPPKWGFEWKFFLEGLGNASDGKPLPQPSYKIDTSLSNPLGTLPPEVAVNPSSLAERNLLRGLRLDLPSGQRVARAMGLAPLTDDELGLTQGGLKQRLGAVGITDVSDDDIAAAAADFAGEAPLWYYILREAEVLAGGHRLGPIGGRIVAEVLIGLLYGDPLSYLRVEPNWRPTLPHAGDDFTLADMIRLATGQG
jgi:Animal haem peroxidase